MNDLRHWNSPSFLIDYIRYYKWVNDTIPEERVIKEENPSKDSICRALEESNKIMSDIFTPESNSFIHLIVIIVLLVFLITVLTLFIYFYLVSIYQNIRLGYYSTAMNEANCDCVLNSPSSSQNEYLKISN